MEESFCDLSIKDLIEVGAHFGHQTHRWNPKMRIYIFEEKNGLYIIDLAKTLNQLRKVLPQVCKVVKENKSILFVGTKKQAKCVIKEAAIEAGEFFVAERWLGGMLTNMITIRNSVKTLNKIERDLSQRTSYLTKKEIALLAKRRDKLLKNLEGVRYLKKNPGLMIVVDPGYEKIAVAEAKKLKIPVLALVDTNCDPTPIDYVIPCNDDSLKSIRLIINVIKDNIIKTKKQQGIEIVSPIRVIEQDLIQDLPPPAIYPEEEFNSSLSASLLAGVDGFDNDSEKDEDCVKDGILVKQDVSSEDPS
ncbi:30S ribosomal protein S2 [Chlamydia gallinacea 08-1274/3]|uniref:Small ribosomal subunit protein uS2 n=1 Tax=Chlamydia gallinacea 08-1274/3 TaxID=1143323 RepID=A0A173DYW7_9CHLA|nr:30S ribosomal protein S2 [Chlamydia gallinacea]ANG66120.1 30S ribosomal protein S2 [Chlamydia gallinacea 08-1274/3]AQT77662.1 30S ribosomal protein S2 [Chlamydia gallinacea]MBX6687203.1 30S ribosomal protein S2 [Chlamydia gallinacea]